MAYKYDKSAGVRGNIDGKSVKGKMFMVENPKVKDGKMPNAKRDSSVKGGAKPARRTRSASY